MAISWISEEHGGSTSKQKILYLLAVENESRLS
jgi:hypothetical protein